MARLCEEVGFDSCFTPEHHGIINGYNPSPLITCAFIAGQTTRLKVGTGVFLLPFYHPLHVAEDAAMIDVLSNGRLILGLGISNAELPWCITLDNSKGISRLRFGAKNSRVNGINDLPVFMHQGSAMPQIGQSPGSSRIISGCIGQVYCRAGEAKRTRSNAMPQLGQSPAWSDSTSGCIGHDQHALMTQLLEVPPRSDSPVVNRPRSARPNPPRCRPWIGAPRFSPRRSSTWVNTIFLTSALLRWRSRQSANKVAIWGIEKPSRRARRMKRRECKSRSS